MEFVFDAWYVAGWSRNFQRALVPLVLLEQNLVFFRQTNDQLVALEDRCPHRLLPLSKGNDLVGNSPTFINVNFYKSTFTKLKFLVNDYR